MRKNLITVVATAVIGFLVAYFITNLLYPSLENFQFKNLNTSITSTISAPDTEIFNFRSINPTVEVYVGNCDDYDENGECIPLSPSTPDDTDTTDEENPEETDNDTDE